MDRSSKVTQLLTIPRPIPVVCKGLAPEIAKLDIIGSPTIPFTSHRQPAESLQGDSRGNLLRTLRLQLLGIYVVAF